MVDSVEEADYWTPILNEVYAGSIDTWDFSWMFNCWAQGFLTALPQVNLVSNLGFGPGATHTIHSGSPLSRMKTSPLVLDRHPQHFLRNRRADEHTFRNIFSAATAAAPTRRGGNWLQRIRPFRKTA
jgi:hypothetical protein